MRTGFWGMNVQRGVELTLSFYALTDETQPFSVIFR